MKRKIIDWQPIEAMARAGNCTYRDLSEKFGIGISTIKGHCCKIGLPLGERSRGRHHIHDWAQIDPLLREIPIMGNVAKVRELHRKYLNIPWHSFMSRYYGVHPGRPVRDRDNSGHPEAESRAPVKMISKQLPLRKGSPGGCRVRLGGSGRSRSGGGDETRSKMSRCSQENYLF